MCFPIISWATKTSGHFFFIKKKYIPNNMGMCMWVFKDSKKDGWQESTYSFFIICFTAGNQDARKVGPQYFLQINVVLVEIFKQSWKNGKYLFHSLCFYCSKCEADDHVVAFFIFQDGIQPMWEDDRNKRGGRWLINLDKKQRHTVLDSFWLETVGIYSANITICQYK